jgi:hypothetical protein
MYFESTTDGVYDSTKGDSSLLQGMASQRGLIDIYDVENDNFQLAGKKEWHYTKV